MHQDMRPECCCRRQHDRGLPGAEVLLRTGMIQLLQNERYKKYNTGQSKARVRAKHWAVQAGPARHKQTTPPRPPKVSQAPVLPAAAAHAAAARATLGAAVSGGRSCGRSWRRRDSGGEGAGAAGVVGALRLHAASCSVAAPAVPETHQPAGCMHRCQGFGQHCDRSTVEQQVSVAHPVLLWLC